MFTSNTVPILEVLRVVEKSANTITPDAIIIIPLLDCKQRKDPNLIPDRRFSQTFLTRIFGLAALKVNFLALVVDSMNKLVGGAAIVCGVIMFRDNVMSVAEVYGASMAPTLEPTGETVVVSRLPIPVRKNHIIVASSPIANYGICKRVIGVAGDSIMRNGEKYVIPEGLCWLEGDNLDKSRDSRMHGPVPISLIRGRVIMSIWPMNKMGRLH